jgi:hypothetical protein
MSFFKGPGLPQPNTKKVVLSHLCPRKAGTKRESSEQILSVHSMASWPQGAVPPTEKINSSTRGDNGLYKM